MVNDPVDEPLRSLPHGCAARGATPSFPAQVTKEPFGKTTDGTPVDIYTLRNRNGVEARICNYGGIVVSLKAPDRNGQMGDVVLGFDNLEDYIKSSPFFGCLVGRYGNRIARGKFTLEGKEYLWLRITILTRFMAEPRVFDKVVWEGKSIASAQGPALELHYLSKDGEEGYPGNLSVTALYHVDRRQRTQARLHRNHG